MQPVHLEQRKVNVSIRRVNGFCVKAGQAEANTKAVETQYKSITLILVTYIKIRNVFLWVYLIAFSLAGSRFLIILFLFVLLRNVYSVHIIIGCSFVRSLFLSTKLRINILQRLDEDTGMDGIIAPGGLLWLDQVDAEEFLKLWIRLQLDVKLKQCYILEAGDTTWQWNRCT